MDSWKFSYPLIIFILVGQIVYVFRYSSILGPISFLLILFYFSKVNEWIFKILLFYRLGLSKKWSIILFKGLRTDITSFFQFVLILPDKFFYYLFFLPSLHLLILLLFLLNSTWLSKWISSMSAFARYHGLYRPIWVTCTVNTGQFG